MKKGGKIAKNVMVVFSVCICIWCVAVKVSGVPPQEGMNVFLYLAGLEQNTGGGTENGGKTGLESEKITHGSENMYLMEDDGIVPFHQGDFPSPSETPDPQRQSLPVEEIVADGGSQIDNFFVKDTTGSGTDLVAALNEMPDVNIKGNGEVEVLLYHTHTSESYMENFSGFYYTDMQTRTKNEEMSVVAVGEEIKKELESAGIGVIHDTTINDTMFNGSYSRSWEVLQKNLQEHPSIQITIDIHRDSMTTQEGIKYKPTADVDGRKAAQIMIMAGCDESGEWGDFPDWYQNLKLALRVQQRASAMYPQMMRPMNFSNSKYNMNATHGSLLIEVGTEVNTISESRYSGKLIGKVLADLLPELKQE